MFGSAAAPTLLAMMGLSSGGSSSSRSERVMRQIYQMFKGEMSPEQMLASARATPEAQFYAHLYAGLYFEATGNRKRARAEITTAADHYTVGGYMHDVAVVHRDILLRSK
jgi:hypothetical protein